ncbi:MAG: tripartite tricarboxylate transporter substrate binding protein [Burkholderiales bacterium]|nr:tripartite tricarboxylate transporter substrate binding protein [Burkholderiales bacterium]
MTTWLPTLGLVLAGALALPLQAQPVADKPVRIVVPFAAGGPTDVVARVLAPRLAAGLKRTVIVENRVGATGAIGAAYVAKSAPDGDTLLLGTSSIMAANPNLTASLPFDPVGDFTPISLVATVENILVVHPSVPVKSVKELVAYAKANPGKLSYASSGVGSTYHLGAEMFRSMTGIEWTHVPYKGAAPAIQDVLAGHVPVMFDNASSAIQNMKAGRVRALGVASLRRYPSLPELPTIAEEGLPGYETTIWIALFVPSKTPAAQVQLLNREVQAAVNSAEYKDRLQGLDMQPRVSSPQELADYLKSDLAKWARVVKDAGIKPE